MKVVFSGTGAAGVSCAKHYIALGVKKENLFMCDRKGVIYDGREDILDTPKEEFAVKTNARTLAEALVGADCFAGLSSGGIVSKEMLSKMNTNPIIFAMANPDPEITYEDAKSVFPDCIMATGRSDYPNQVNNVLGFPFIFRGALDVCAKDINEEMKLAATLALAKLTKKGDIPQSVLEAYNVEKLEFGKDYIIPKPLDPRVLVDVSLAVAKAAVKSGVAEEPKTDWVKYEAELVELAERING
jgi:malate dehydrogenase (oxaloacetate-decarboxylating)(NADP+)